MVARMNRLTQRFLLSLSLVLFLFNGKASADSTAIAYTDVNWAAVTFSGPVAPAPLPFNSYSTLAIASGRDLSSSNPNEFIAGGVNTAVGWVPLTETAQITPQSFAVATAATDLTALSTVAGDYSLSAQVERSGSITPTDGKIQINVPYSFSISMTNDPTGPCCDSASTTVLVELFGPPQNRIFAVNGGVNFVDSLGSVTSYNKQGVFTFTADDLEPGTYFFDVGAFSEVEFVPEPSGLFLLCVGLLCLGGMSIRRRFA
jgi:hypothetical protein